jgi:hypothetical protein
MLVKNVHVQTRNDTEQRSLSVLLVPNLHIYEPKLKIRGPEL